VCEKTTQNKPIVMCNDEKDLLTQIAYCAEWMFDCEIKNNIGEAEDWKRQLKIATNKYYDWLMSGRRN